MSANLLESQPATACLADDPSQSTVRASDLIAALSFALDITEGQPEGHAAKTCLIGSRLAEALGLDPELRSDLYYALLLKDLGCSSNASKMCYLFGADDRSVKHDIKTVDWTQMTESFKFITQQVTPAGSPLHKALKVAALLVQGPQGARKLIETRCERGADVARGMGFSERTAEAILHLDEHWNGKGHPLGLCGDEISLAGRIAGLAQTVEVFYAQHGLESALVMAAERSGKWFDPMLVDALLGLGAKDRLWTELESDNPLEIVSRYEPEDQLRRLDEEGIDRIAQGFARVVDAKSPWTYRHSEEVSKIAVGVACELGYSEPEMRRVRRMGLVHDLGKLGVSNAVLDKPERPTAAEFEQLKLHTHYTHEILTRAGCFGDLAEVAASHHEKLDGSGYHRGLVSDDLDQTARLLTVADMYEAMTASRPYREGMPRERVLEILEQDAGDKLCPDAVAALKQWLDHTDFASRMAEQMRAVERLLKELN